MLIYFEHPLTYIALLLIFCGLYYLFTKRQVKTGTSYLILAPKEALFANALGVLTGNSPKDQKPVIIPKWEKNLFGCFFLIAGLALAVMQYYILK